MQKFFSDFPILLLSLSDYYYSTGLSHENRLIRVLLATNIEQREILGLLTKEGSIFIFME